MTQRTVLDFCESDPATVENCQWVFQGKGKSPAYENPNCTPWNSQGAGAKGAKVCRVRVRGAKVFLCPDMIPTFELFFATIEWYQQYFNANETAMNYREGLQIKEYR